jgi:type IV secretory pathway VirB10-like protein
MQTKPENARSEVPLKVLWKWTGVSAALHVLFIGALCGVSYWGHLKKEEANKAKAAAEEAALKKKEAEEAKKAATNAPPAVVPNAPAAVPKADAVTAAPAASTNRQTEAEKILGIDKVAKPGDLPKSPFSSKNDDLLKDLK